LLHQWDVERALVEHQQLEIQTIDYKDKQAMLRQVAYQMQAAEKGLAGNLIAADELEGILTKYLQTLDINNSRAVARVMIKQLRERNFILCFMGADYYAFVHRTFLEYFCAWEYVWQFEKERTLSLEELKSEVFGKHWQDESWHEVLRLIVGMIEPKFAVKIIDNLIDKDGKKENFLNIFLAADCLGEVGIRSALMPICTRLHRDLKGLTKYRQNDWLNLPHTEVNLIFEIRYKALAAIATIWKDDPETLPWLKNCALSDSDKDVDIRMSALEELAKGWRDDPDTLPIIKNCTLSDNHPSVQDAAVLVLARYWKDKPDTLVWLKEKAQYDDDGYVRRAAVQELAKGWKDDPDTLALLKQKAQSDDDGYVRITAVRELAKGWGNDPDTLLLLKQKAQSDDDWFMREAAVRELAKGWKNDPETLPILKQKAQSDDDSAVRSAAMQELGKGWKYEPWLFELLRDRALNDPFVREEDRQINPRQLAIEIIIKQYPNHPQTLPLLRDRAENDPDEKVREFAKKNWHN
jgi:predicted NACHT family NTPase